MAAAISGARFAKSEASASNFWNDGSPSEANTEDGGFLALC
jgi:hypothetical protein